MSWNTRKKVNSGLSARQKREVRKIAIAQQPRQWEALFEVGPCQCVPLQAEECTGVQAIQVAQSPGTSPAWGELVIHRVTGGLWFTPDAGGSDTACDERESQLDDIRMRLALVKHQVAVDGSGQGFDPWSADWYQGDNVLWKHEHLFFSEWSTAFVPEMTSEQSFPRTQGITLLATGTSVPFPLGDPCLANPLAVGVANVYTEPCESGPFVTEAYCVQTQRQARPYYMSAHHIRKGLRLKDGESLYLIVGWASTCNEDGTPKLLMTGGIYGETTETTGI